MRVYHHRLRDGERVVWYQDGGQLRAITRAGRVYTDQSVATAILASVIGGPKARRLAAEFAAALASWGESWDVTADEIREWADGRPGA